MKLRVKNLILGLSVVSCATFLSACAGGYVGGGAVVDDNDYYGRAYGGPVIYGHPYYRNDSHVASPPRRNWHGGDKPSAPAHENHSPPAKQSHSAPAQSDHNRK